MDYLDAIESAVLADDELDVDEEQFDALLETMGDAELFMERILKIQNKRGELVSLLPNRSQLKLAAEIKRQEELGIPVRVIILKARQEGITTFVSGRYYWCAATSENTNVGIIAHVEKASTGVLDKMKLFYDESPSIYKPMKKSCNAKQLLFENPSTNEKAKERDPGLRSKILIESAMNKNAFRSYTIHYLHLSELAFYPYATETLTSALQAVPHEPRTAVIVESTANGVGGVFYDMWNSAVAGESEFVPLFFPWFDHDEYALPVPDDFKICEEELELKAKYGISDEQLVWRRWCITANCNSDIDQFRQEYPSEPREAFLASGRPVFDVDMIDIALKAAKDAPFCGSVYKDDKKGMSFRTEYGAPLKIWEKPTKGEHYILGVDSSAGDKGGDPACIAIYHHETVTQVAEWHGFVPPERLGQISVDLAKYYNDGFIMPEANNHGVSVIDAIKNTGYRRLFKRKKLPDEKKEENMPKYGFYTSSTSKKYIISKMAKFIKEGVRRIKSKNCLLECSTYVRDDSDKTNAQSGCHDDRVMAHALAIYACSIRSASTFKSDGMNVQEMYGISSKTGY